MIAKYRVYMWNLKDSVVKVGETDTGKLKKKQASMNIENVFISTFISS